MDSAILQEQEQDKQEQRSWSWCDIESDIVGRIVECMGGSRIDILRIRGVCRSWRSCTPLPPILPYSLNIPDLMDPSDPGYVEYVITETTIYSLQPLHDHTACCFFVRILHLPEGCRFVVYIPKKGLVETSSRFLSSSSSKEESSSSSNKKNKKSRRKGNAVFKELTSSRLDFYEEKDRAYRNWPLPEAINLLDFRVHEICKDHRMEATGWEIRLSSAVAVSSGFNDIFPGNDHHHHKKNTFAAMVNSCQQEERLVVWRKGDEKWTRVLDPAHEYFTMFLYSAGNGGKFYAFNHRGCTFTIDPLTMKRTQVAPGPKNQHQYCCASFDNNYKLRYVLQVPPARGGSSSSINIIILGVFWHYQRFDIQVERLDEEKQQWIKADGDELKDVVAFFGPNYNPPIYSFTCCAKYVPGYKPNCIYFDKSAEGMSREPPPKPACGHPGSELVVFEMEENGGHATELCDQYGCSPILWPPPPWLVPPPPPSCMHAYFREELSFRNLE